MHLEDPTAVMPKNLSCVGWSNLVFALKPIHKVETEHATIQLMISASQTVKDFKVLKDFYFQKWYDTEASVQSMHQCYFIYYEWLFWHFQHQNNILIFLQESTSQFR